MSSMKRKTRGPPVKRPPFWVRKDALFLVPGLGLGDQLAEAGLCALG